MLIRCLPYPNQYIAHLLSLSCGLVALQGANLHTNICLYQPMNGHLRIKSPWVQLAVFLLVFLPQLLLLFFFSDSNVKIDLTKPGVIAQMKWLQAVSSLTLFFLPAFLFAVFTFRSKYFYFLGFKKADKENMYILAVVCIVLAMPFVFWLGVLNQSFPIPAELKRMEEETAKQLAAFLKVNGPIDVVINVIVIALLPAICEELCFRGALQRILINITRNPWAGIIITGILFSALHLQFMGFLPRMFLGIVLGALYWYSGSLWTSILAHFVNNAVQVIAVSYAPKYIDKNPEFPVLLAIASGVIVWAILWYYQRQSTITYSKVYRTDELTPHNQFLA